MIIATYNVNSVKARAHAVVDWLRERSPDVVVLQETKCTDDVFPKTIFEDCGYCVEVHGQKSYNGVAILSKITLEDVRCGLPGDDEDDQARWIEATVVNKRALRICGLYLPNGNPAPGPKFDYKIKWMQRAYARAKILLADEMPTIMAGDYNVIPQNEDCKNPEQWVGDALTRAETRAAFRRIINLGFTDAFRLNNSEAGHYSFWDYQAGAWNKDNGIRIDHLLLSSQATDRFRDSGIDKFMRGRERPSDHVPVWIELNL
ncbi:MAG: exodeoxyribonuclease III [Aestuariivita sp.]|nr:exodeoxyribonuclease III [Aestuariivita sp.]MCY4203201.1 exodeoxyribonuclease III [Aestuariivita sp.]MCY4289061.1 exodeoxyribonuclease III [Aestuariivita sp.]MCY4345751.1 exodeoxyribonuclease III [Aestuariivita sp.]